jgi:starch phosphorylase
MLNGAVTLCTVDGSNRELLDLVGEENAYTFGISAQEVLDRFRLQDYDPARIYDTNDPIREAVDFLVSPVMMETGNRERLSRLYEELRYRDRYMTLQDLEEYIRTKDHVLEDYENRKGWAAKMLTNIARSGYFSADRTIAEYNRDIWKLKSFKTYSEEGK